MGWCTFNIAKVLKREHIGTVFFWGDLLDRSTEVRTANWWHLANRPDYVFGMASSLVGSALWCKFRLTQRGGLIAW